MAVKAPVAVAASAGKLALPAPEAGVSSVRDALHVAPPSVDRRIQTWPLPPTAVAPEYSRTSAPVESDATVVVDDVSKSTPVVTVSAITRDHDIPPLIVRHVSMSTFPLDFPLPFG